MCVFFACVCGETATTGVGGKDDGRRYVFQCDDARGAAKWAQMIRYSMSTHRPSSKAAAAGGMPAVPWGIAPGIPQCGLGQVVDQLYGNAAQWVFHHTHTHFNQKHT